MRFFDFLWQNPLCILCLWLAIINFTAFIVMGIDKYKSTHQKWRITEKALFIFAAIGGSIGGIAGIYAFRHKTLRKKFTLGFPAILIIQLALGIFVYIYTK